MNLLFVMVVLTGSAKSFSTSFYVTLNAVEVQQHQDIENAYNTAQEMENKKSEMDNSEPATSRMELKSGPKTTIRLLKLLARLTRTAMQRKPTYRLV